MICAARALPDVFTVEPTDAPLPDEAAELVAAWLLGIVEGEAEAAQPAGDREEEQP
jgi:hypothetical protein